ncbi:hypothetical protein SAMN02745165_03414 [Malonomonas rubra DSM 5091]|uniref:Uncharacterized protein n=1 Tax=Malonomonas rubra DSM 5091 TaxID=1122189 RepID=A0A1M6MUW4_MALRU|nr:hypothetical protein [Malonomonas rubra]SHJ87295.1 hypothetical protein SAMN02745165_03414 [Malonomonas rubra DSM 5091]
MSDVQEFSAGLKKVRQRRILLWLTIAVYVPAMMISLQSAGGWNTVIKVFIVWLILLCVVVALAVVVRCPDCGNCFHTHGPTFFPVRRCVHCGLHVNADKKGDDRPDRE